MTQGRKHEPGDRDDRLSRYLAGALPPEDGAALEGELLADPEASEALYAQLNLQAALDESARRRVLRRVTPRRILALALPLAAALALLWLGPRWEEKTRVPPSPRLRGLPGAVRPLEPRGELPVAPRRFRWQSTPGAASYRFELYDETAALRYEAVLRDTLALLPADAAGLPLSVGYWRVVPVDSMGAELSPSEPLSFSTAGARP